MHNDSTGHILSKLRPALVQPGLSWSIAVRDTVEGNVLFEHDADRALDTASMGKLILLAYVGNELARNPEQGGIRLNRRAVEPVADSGIWQHLDVDELSIADISRLVFLCSDNLATNMLLNHFQLERVRAFRTELALAHTDLLDFVRDTRRAGDPETLSRGSAAELCAFMLRTARGELISPDLSGWLRRGMTLNTDLSMVPARFGLDPLAHFDTHRGTAVANKTGTDTGVRADAGIITLESRELAYAAICNYDANAATDAEVLALMQSVGAAMMEPGQP